MNKDGENLHIYSRRGREGKLAGMTTYVDDHSPSGDDEDEVEQMVKCLLETYEGRELGVLGKIVGMNLAVSEGSITMDQVNYAENIVLEGKRSMEEVRKVYTPLDPGMDLSARRDEDE